MEDQIRYQKLAAEAQVVYQIAAAEMDESIPSVAAKIIRKLGFPLNVIPDDFAPQLGNLAGGQLNWDVAGVFYKRLNPLDKAAIQATYDALHAFTGISQRVFLWHHLVLKIPYIEWIDSTKPIRANLAVLNKAFCETGVERISDLPIREKIVIKDLFYKSLECHFSLLERAKELDIRDKGYLFRLWKWILMGPHK